jgi:general secretion pathway protein K
MALVVVLWTMALISALAMAASTSFRGFAGVIGLSQDKIKADALLSSGLEAAASLLGALGDEKPLIDTQMVIKLSTGSAEIRLSDEGGRINVNKAPVAVLASLFHSIGADDANGVAQSIDAWRMRDQAGHPQTASDNKSLAAASFTDIGQLAQVPGLTNDLLAAVAPMITVYGDDKVNALTAPIPVLAALPGIGHSKAEALFEARLRSPMTESMLQAMLGPAADALKLQSRPIALIEVTARLIDGFSEAARAVIVVLPHDRVSYRVLAWTPLAAPSGPGSDPVAAGERRDEN